MRGLIDQERLRGFMRALGNAARSESRVYLTGGASAVLMGWRPSTIDVDIEIRPESNEVLRAIPRLKEELQINVELASPHQAISSRSCPDGRSAAHSSLAKATSTFTTTTSTHKRWPRSSARIAATSSMSVRCTSAG